MVLMGLILIEDIHEQKRDIANLVLASSIGLFYDRYKGFYTHSESISRGRWNFGMS